MAEDKQTIHDFHQYLEKKVDEELENENESKNNVDEQKNQKRKNDDNEKSEEEDEEQQEEDEENFQSETEESESEMSEYDEDEEDEDDKALMDLLLKQILACHKKKKNKDLNKKSSFVSSLKSFLNLNMETRAKKINEKHVHDFLFLTDAILQKKIKIRNLSSGDLSHLKEIVSRNIDAKDRKIILAEDIRLHGIFKKALAVVEKGIKLNKSKNVKI